MYLPLSKFQSIHWVSIDATVRTSLRYGSETIQHTLLECSAFTKERDTFLKRFYEMHPIARGLSPEGLCDVLMSDDLPHETENTMYRYLIAISRLRLGILTERGEGS